MTNGGCGGAKKSRIAWVARVRNRGVGAWLRRSLLDLGIRVRGLVSRLPKGNITATTNATTSHLRCRVCRNASMDYRILFALGSWRWCLVALLHYNYAIAITSVNQVSLPRTFHASTATDEIATSIAITPRKSVASVASSSRLRCLSHAVIDRHCFRSSNNSTKIRRRAPQ